MHQTLESLISVTLFNFLKIYDSSSTWKYHRPGNQNFSEVKLNSINVKSSRTKYIFQIGVKYGLDMWLMHTDLSLTNNRKKLQWEFFSKMTSCSPLSSSWQAEGKMDPRLN